MEWAEETIVRLRDLWSEGHSTAEIGRRLGVSKNAVVGKAHRLDLPARPSPIRREGERPPPRRGPPRQFNGPTLPPLSSTALASTSLSSTPSGPVQPVAPLPLRPTVVVPQRASSPSPRVVLSPPPRPYGRVITCCWPIGEPGTKSFHFCDAESEPGKPYCPDHAKRAYVKLKDRREDAA
jgi:GcrA cell cycle regulator